VIFFTTVPLNLTSNVGSSIIAVYCIDLPRFVLRLWHKLGMLPVDTFILLDFCRAWVCCFFGNLLQKAKDINISMETGCPYFPYRVIRVLFKRASSSYFFLFFGLLPIFCYFLKKFLFFPIF